VRLEPEFSPSRTGIARSSRICPTGDSQRSQPGALVEQVGLLDEGAAPSTKQRRANAARTASSMLPTAR
jgi:hypothetical protein